MYGGAGRDLVFLLVSYTFNSAIVLLMLRWFMQRHVGLAGVWACLVSFQVGTACTWLGDHAHVYMCTGACLSDHQCGCQSLHSRSDDVHAYAWILLISWESTLAVLPTLLRWIIHVGILCGGAGHSHVDEWVAAAVQQS